MKLSIIIPVYNVEAYIRKCLLSTQDQDLPKEEYEVIVVNDGSPDNCAAIVAKMSLQHPNIKLINQDNKGVSAARNKGLENATGDFLLFIDPDDYLEKNCLKYLCTLTQRQRLDILMFGISEVQTDGKVTFMNVTQPSVNGVRGDELYLKFRQVRGENALDACYGMIIRSGLIQQKGLRFLENVPYLEDGEFIARLMALAEVCGYCDRPFYKRLIRPGSATNSALFYQDRAAHGFIRAAKNLKDFRTSMLENARTRFLNQSILKFCMLAIQSCVKPGNFNKYAGIRSSIQSNGLNQIEIKGATGVFFFYGALYALSIDLFFVAWTIRSAFLSMLSRLKTILPFK